MNPNSIMDILMNKYVALFFICALGFGNYFCYDVPGALAKQIQSVLSVNQTEFATLYAFYSWPNVIMCFFGGILIDRVFGIRLGAIVFLALLVIGQMFVTIGAFKQIFWLMQLGRFIYGLGGESLTVAQNTYVVSWFKGRELNAVFGCQITVSRGGSSLAYLVMHPIFDFFIKKNYHPIDALGIVMLLATMTVILSFLISFVIAFIDKRKERMQGGGEEVQASDVGSIKDLTKFNSTYWILNVTCVTFYMAVFPFIAFGSNFLQKKWKMEQDTANTCVSLIYILSAVLSPFIGILVDKVGHNITFMVGASFILMASHAILALTYVSPWVMMIFIGIGYSVMCSVLWPIVAMIVPRNQLGTAYGLMQAIQNLGLALGADATGFIVDSFGYVNMMLSFVFLAGISLVSCMFLMIINLKVTKEINIEHEP